MDDLSEADPSLGKTLLWGLVLGTIGAAFASYVRGGFTPWVTGVFAASGFFLASLLAWLFNAPRLARFSGPARSEGTAWGRDLAAAALAAGCLFWSGPVIQGAGYGGWVVALLLAIITPLIVCLVAARRTVLFGLVVTTCLSASAFAHQPQFDAGLLDPRGWVRFGPGDLLAWTLIWMLLSVLSLVVSIPLARRRRRLATIR